MATMNRIISQETEPEISRFSYMAAAPHVAPDTVYFDHVGAQFPSRKGSHPHCVDVSEDEATEVQPSVTTPRAQQYYQLQHSPERGLQQRSPFTPEHTPPQGGSYVSLQGMYEIRRQRSKKYGRNDWYFDSKWSAFVALHLRISFSRCATVSNTPNLQSFGPSLGKHIVFR